MLTHSRRLILWLPVLFAAGALAYLSLTFEPVLVYPLVPIGPAAFMAHRFWRAGRWQWRALAAFAIFCCGFAWMQLYTQLNHVTMLTNEQRITDVSGRIIAISDVPKGYRITLDKIKIPALDPEKTPQRVRLKLRGSSGEGLLTGQHVALRAGLLPPTGPVMPGAFDFARYFYFQGIGAVGYAIPPVQVLEETDGSANFWQWLTKLREGMSERVRSQMSAPEGAVAAALMMGDRAAIPDEVNQVMRDTNLSHILAISGMHMALVTGLLFFSLRWLLVALPQTRHVRNPKKLAAWMALVAGALYLLLAGLPISACRAYIMVALVFGAILLDRQVMPMRSLALAAMLLLLINPSYAVQPGFQLSFLATAALIAWYERVRSAAEHWFDPQEKRKRVLLYIGGVLMTSLVAELATAPLVLYHFNTVSLYGLLANLIIMPIISFLVMPAIVIAYLLWPLGLEGIALTLVEWGIGAMIAVARWVAAIPGAQFFSKAPPGWGVALSTGGMLWLFIVTDKRRFYGLAAIALGMGSVFTVRSPDILISGDGKQIAGRVDGDLMMLKGRAGSFTPQQWAHGSGMAALQTIPKEYDAWRCDVLGCVFRFSEQIVAFPSSFEAQAEDCKRADWVMTPFYLYASECDARRIDRRAREKGGAHWLWFEGNEMGSAYALQGERPWSER